MVLPGHLAGGYLAARAALFLTHVSFTSSQTAVLLTVGTLAGEFPDIDLLFYYLNQRAKTARKIDDHRTYITHAPLVWLITSLALVAAGWLAGSTFMEWIGWMVLSGTMSHFILDSIEHGIPWLWPLSRKRFALRRTPDENEPTADRGAPARKGTFRAYWRFVTGPYLRSWTMWAELVITLAAIWTLFH